MAAEIKVEIENHIAKLTLNRPSKLNPITYEMWVQLVDILSQIAAMNDVRVLLISGAGDKAFSVGADIADFEKHRSDVDSARVYAMAVESSMNAIEAFPKPTVAMIKGYCMGGGLELAIACDIRIAASNVSLGIPAAKLGLTIGYQEAKRLVQIMGRDGALFTLLTGRIMNGKEALKRGLVHELVDIGSIEEYTFDLVCEISELAPVSHTIHKTIINSVSEIEKLNNLTKRELELPLSIFGTQDFLEGRTAFLEKRRPQFKGL